VLVFGLNQPFNLRIMASTFKDGDPSYAGALGGVALGLKSYHIFELKDEIPEDVWEHEMAFEELEIEDELIEQICATMREIRGEGDTG
jgi:glycine reductase